MDFELPTNFGIQILIYTGLLFRFLIETFVEQKKWNYRKKCLSKKVKNVYLKKKFFLSFNKISILNFWDFIGQKMKLCIL